MAKNMQDFYVEFGIGKTDSAISLTETHLSPSVETNIAVRELVVQDLENRIEGLDPDDSHISSIKYEIAKLKHTNQADILEHVRATQVVGQRVAISKSTYQTPDGIRLTDTKAIAHNSPITKDKSTEIIDARRHGVDVSRSTAQANHMIEDHARVLAQRALHPDRIKPFASVKDFVANLKLGKQIDPGVDSARVDKLANEIVKKLKEEHALQVTSDLLNEKLTNQPSLIEKAANWASSIFDGLDNEPESDFMVGTTVHDTVSNLGGGIESREITISTEFDDFYTPLQYPTPAGDYEGVIESRGNAHSTRM